MPAARSTSSLASRSRVTRAVPQPNLTRSMSSPWLSMTSVKAPVGSPGSITIVIPRVRGRPGRVGAAVIMLGGLSWGADTCRTVRGASFQIHDSRGPAVDLPELRALPGADPVVGVELEEEAAAAVGLRRVAEPRRGHHEQLEGAEEAAVRGARPAHHPHPAPA